AMSRAAEVPSDDTGLLAAVRFRPGGAAPLLGVPAASLTDQALGAEQLACLRALPSALAQSCERAAHPRPGDHAPGAAAPRQVLAALERWLLGRAAASPGPDPLVAHAVARLFGAAPPHTDALAREVGFSRQHLRRRFLDQVGLAPKELARVARLQRAVARLQRQRAGGLAAAALELGFFDQAHMARELRLLAGLTARAVTASAGSIFPIHSLLAEADCGHEEAHPQPDRGRHRDLPGVLGGPARLRQDRGGAGG
ncbi:MAG TPA: helix-turn-helix domain-containing protein, partial [Kofleriaceae bacterium]|nr:helix-turn-helix domain-containing protein [Kofleriaceae bacterium]